MHQTSEEAWAALGLDTADHAVYLTVLEGADREAVVTARTGQDEEAVARSLARLRGLGLVGSGADGGVVAGEPALTLRRAAGRLHSLAGELLTESADLQALHDRAHGPDRNQPDLRVLASLQETQRAFADLLAGAEREVLACVKPPFLATGDFSDDEHDQLDRGVVYRVVYDPEAVEAIGGPELLASFVRAGEQARVTDAIPLKMFLVDGTRALLPLAGDEGVEDGGALLVTSPGLVSALVALFESVWVRAWDLQAPAPPSGLALDDRDRQIISALRIGATDDAIARRLGVTPRTVGRRLARLLELTGAATRFQLGWRLAVLSEETQEDPAATGPSSGVGRLPHTTRAPGSV
ncbi:helix-turn-helix domain-containing protein [Ornithinimicrobium cavernae]|uniref:helix-turn-helix domain-containing protein n=1 Tax=Ornithinimicrobium cavernae TaxID=2666047 RepID=UPI0012B18558|nr:helix-turn-helix domain-containing protein [Ornithinimicrobium cavernae]